MAKGIFNGIEVEEHQEALTNKELADLIVDRMSWDKDDDEEIDMDGYHAKAPVWGSLNDRWGNHILFDVTSAGYSCISPDLILHAKPKTYDHTGTIREESDYDQPAVTHFQSDQFGSWGTITAPEQFFTLTHYGDTHPPSLINDGWTGYSEIYLAYQEPFKPNEPTKVIQTHYMWEKRNIVPKYDQAEREQLLGGPVCIHGNLAESCSLYKELGVYKTKCTPYRKYIVSCESCGKSHYVKECENE